MLPTLFNYQGQQVRTLVKDGEPWFVAKDVCDILEITNSRDAVSRLDEDERDVVLTDTLGGQQNMQAVNEPGIYSLILGSRKPEAKAFKRWITHEVIPTIRKTGGYVANENIFVETYLPFADDQTKALFKFTLETVRKQNEKITELQPKANYFDAIVDRNLLTNFRDTAKELKIKESALITWMLEKKNVYRDQSGKLKPYAEFVPSLFEMKEWERNNKSGTQTLITPRGRETFRLLLEKVG
jgi:prophage antirepressor-like protein